ncbi:hypothetical protein [Roseibium sp.]|uniref:hypothetical protein n=1 Tax=Roseibium sp. TaxID=1936156 RepID=UPI003265B5A8
MKKFLSPTRAIAAAILLVVTIFPTANTYSQEKNAEKCVSIDEICLSSEDLKELKTEIDRLVSVENFSGIYVLLEKMDLGDDQFLLQSRATVFFSKDGKSANKCSSVRDLERMAENNPTVAISLLNLIYRNAWKQTAALEGSLLARIHLVDDLLERSDRGFDTVLKFNAKLFYEDLLSLLKVDYAADIPTTLYDRIEEKRSELIEVIGRNGIDISQLNIRDIKPITIICDKRY